MILKKVDKSLTGKFQTENSLVRNPLSPKTIHDVQLSKSKGARVRLGLLGAKSATKLKKPTTNPDFAKEHQVAKRQKLEWGNSREEAAVTFTSTADMVKKFQSSMRDLELPHKNRNVLHESITSPIQRKAKLSFTRPKGPQFEISHQGHSVRVKNFVKIEGDMMANIPKFKARPVNKKILQSKGDLGLFCKLKCQVKISQEFYFATDERVLQEKSVTDLFDKLSLNSEPRRGHQIKRSTMPLPFHLNTEERGAEKKQKFLVDARKSQLQEERARIPRATPYPYTTDFPAIPPKPEPKQCTKPEPFQLESLVRHEEEIQKKIKEREKLNEEAAQMRLFKAQTILKDDPLPVPEKKRKPLTQVKDFASYADNRAIERADFDEKVKEIDMMRRRYKEEVEFAKMMGEEEAQKQLRKTLVLQARPIPNFDKPFRPQKSSKEPTDAKSPKLCVVQRKQKWTRAAASEFK